MTQPFYKLLKDLPDLSAGAIFVFDEEYLHWTNDLFYKNSYYFDRATILQEDWFEEINSNEFNKTIIQ